MHRISFLRLTESPVYVVPLQFEFEVTDAGKQVLQVHCWDYDFGTKDDPMGDLEVRLSDVVRSGGRVSEGSYALRNCAHGTLRLTLIFKGEGQSLLFLLCLLAHPLSSLLCSARALVSFCPLLLHLASFLVLFFRFRVSCQNLSFCLFDNPPHSAVCGVTTN